VARNSVATHRHVPCSLGATVEEGRLPAGYRARVDALDADLMAFYDQQADDRAGRDLQAERIERRSAFIAQIAGEGRRTVVEIGTGTGQDAMAFLSAGLDFVGVDLSIAHVRHATAQGVAAVQGSLYDVPFRQWHFEAGWTMSTLLHVPDSRFDEAMRSITSLLASGAVIAIGVWGGRDEEFTSEFDRIKPPRFFSLRSDAKLRSLLSRFGTIEHFDTWPDVQSDWTYQFTVLRLSA
jgi:SAM-dependent methyltransferase